MTLTEVQFSWLSELDRVYQRWIVDGQEQPESTSRLMQDWELKWNTVQCSSQFPSPNEHHREFSLIQLRFLMIPAYLSAFYAAQSSVDATSTRLTALEKSLNYAKEFVDLLRDCQCISEKWSTNSDDGLEAPTSTAVMVQSREEKIQRFKRKKETMNLLAAIQQRRRSSAEDESRSRPTNQEVEEDDDDLLREYTMAFLDFLIQQTMESLPMLRQEQELLRFREKQLSHEQVAKETEVPDPREPGDSSWKLDRPNLVNKEGPLLSKDGKPLRPFVITNQREELKDGVFRAGHRLPTMSIDDYLQKEYERGNILTGGGQKEPPKKPEIDDNDYAALDAETERLRQWDLFTDDNPRGSGNRMNRG